MKAARAAEGISEDGFRVEIDFDKKQVKVFPRDRKNVSITHADGKVTVKA